MRRQSLTSSLSSGSGGAAEPLIVVEESTLAEEESEKPEPETPPRCSLDPDSPSLNPYLLSPWRETRKHSLPTPQCTTGITASQVRRLSERGGEGSGPSPREAAFLATLSQSSPPQPGGRRHSVVTISRVPSTLFGRNRRESIAAFPVMGGATRILGNRRDSTGPPSNSGSTHNLALDIMDDIAEIKAARKVRLKMWKTGSRERVCEVQPLEGNGSGPAQRYTGQQRRYSDFALATIPAASATRRRASEMPRGPPPPIPPRSGVQTGGAGTPTSGIVCTNTDLLSILSSLTSSATEINRCGVEEDKDLKALVPSSSSAAAASASSSAVKTIEQKRNRLKSNRSNSFDVSILHGCGDSRSSTSSAIQSGRAGGGGGIAAGSLMSPSSWFAKRHQPMSKKQRPGAGDSTSSSSSGGSSFKFEKSRVVKAVKDKVGMTSPTKDEVAADAVSAGAGANVAGAAGSSASGQPVRWDGSSVQSHAQVLGSAIEEFLRSGSSSGAGAAVQQEQRAPAGSNEPTDEKADSCEPSICSSLKDLFVK